MPLLSGSTLGSRITSRPPTEWLLHPLASLKKAEKRLRKEQRHLARKRKGSKNRVKQRRRVARTYERISNRRRDFLHRTSRRIVDSSSGLAFEKLRVANMLKNHHLAKAIANAGWSTFVLMVAYKAEKAGKPFVLVEPHGTTQLCSNCGSIVEKNLAERFHRCHCGLVLDRDHNAAINVASRAGTVRSHACGETASVDEGSHLQVVSRKQEAPPL